MACAGPGTAGSEEAQEGFALLEAALPSRPDNRESSIGRCMQQLAERVVIGMDPHKRSVTIEVMTGDETILGGGRYGTDEAGFAAMTDYVTVGRGRPTGCGRSRVVSGIGRHVALRLLAAGEQVVDVPPKLSAQVRVFATGQGRKTDATDAHSIALVGTRVAGLRPVVDDAQLDVLRVLADRRRPWVRSTPGRSPSCTPCCSS